ncbi:MAG: glucuronate isomerase [Alistipes sp.]|nr:glucuronate isomerase [Candidatus Alistipes equi]
MAFIDNDFLLTTKTASKLYHEHAESLPIIDYHCHLDPKQIASDYRFQDISEMWLGGDHYKWRAMRACAVDEHYITGDADPKEKFLKWAQTVPYLMRNPLYHWTHLELKRVFGIDELLNSKTAEKIYEQCNEKLASNNITATSLIKQFNVEVVCTTDDPSDTLEHHAAISKKHADIRVLPAFRADKALAADNPNVFNEWIVRLEKTSGVSIGSYAEMVMALQLRHDFFEKMGCRVSDHGLDTFYAADYTDNEIETIFAKIREGIEPSRKEVSKFRSAVLHDLAVMDARCGWVQQFHIGPIRNNNTKMFLEKGPDLGFDSIGDLPSSDAGHRFFDRLTSEGALAKTILYCLNPKDFEMMAAMAFTFCDGTEPGKMQLGAAWWFLDHEYGIRRQLDVLSSFGPLSRFVGMLTDSRSFLSYTRHEYFRRILCSVIAEDVESGRMPKSEMDFIQEMVKDISYYNAKDYFKF